MGPRTREIKNQIGRRFCSARPGLMRARESILIVAHDPLAGTKAASVAFGPTSTEK